MSNPSQSTVRNRLLRAMSAEDFALLSPHLSFGQMPRGTVLFGKGAALDTIWFLDSGIVSLVAISEEGQRVEVGVVGREGFVPVPVILGSDRAPYEASLQVPDDSYALGADVLRQVMKQSSTLAELLLRYAHTLHLQTVYTALANAIHPIDERLARWLLMLHDRGSDNEIVLTHEFMSTMLAVRRPSVTTSLHVLEGNGFIRSERGRVIIRNRAALEEFAGDGYGVPEQEYERLIGSPR